MESLEQNIASQRLTIIGTTHVDRSSIERVRKTISEGHPSVVAVELDDERLWALRDPHRDRLISPIRSGPLAWLMALLERSVGSLTGVFPGSEMLEAVNEAQRVGAQVAMIDKPIDTILSDLSTLPLREKLRIGTDIVVALLAIGTRRKSVQPENTSLNALMEEFDAKYPTLSRILVRDRDKHMAGMLRGILQSCTGQVVAVVGLGHVRGIMQYLNMGQRATSGEMYGIRYEWTLVVFPR